ncbi:MAG TPA: DUF6082 family protein [Micromonosporaceae bacterium]|nr:DUF6082 family protein [Micromonosporaceae bacterium]
MSMPPVRPERSLHRVAVRLAWAAGLVALVGAVVIGVALSPVAISLIEGDRDWVRLSTIGQAYGPVSALLSAVALGVVVLLQRHQLRHERRAMGRAMHLELLQVALDDPVYAQCWGPRMAPRDVDERLFFYASAVLSLWLHSYEIGELREDRLRSFVQGFFMAELPRAYWSWHGQWRLAGAHGRRRRFLLLVDEEFRAAERAGPPRRRLERAAPAQRRADRLTPRRRRSAPRRRSSTTVVG